MRFRRSGVAEDVRPPVAGIFGMLYYYVQMNDSLMLQG